MGGGDDEPQSGLVTICAIAAAAGIVIGFVGGAFRWCLVRSADWAADVIDWSHEAAAVGWLLPLALAALAAVVARAIVLRVPLAAGSGIQHVEAVWRGEAAFAPVGVVPAKVAGGVLALASGLLLGRKGPTVQMGAVIGVETGRRFTSASTTGASCRPPSPAPGSPSRSTRRSEGRSSCSRRSPASSRPGSCSSPSPAGRSPSCARDCSSATRSTSPCPSRRRRAP